MTRSNPKSIDQYCAGFSSGDAISNEALIIQRFLRSLGFQSEIYCEQYSESDAHLVKHFRQSYPSQDSIVIYHHSYSTRILESLDSFQSRKILIFHNMTPAHFVRRYNRSLASSLEQTWNSLSELTQSFDAVLADSHFNAEDLHHMGFSDVQIMPVTVPPPDALTQKSGNPRMSFLDDGMLNILFVGRIFPNKKHQDLIKSFYFFNRLHPASRLLLPGAFHPGVRAYTAELNNLITELELNDRVVFTGMITDEDLHACYQKSDLFLSTSEHEGFFVPLVESMYYEIPVMAYGSSVIPETMGESGVLFYDKDPVLIAELMDTVLTSEDIRSSIIESQKERAIHLAPEKSLLVLTDTLKTMGVNLPDNTLESIPSFFQQNSPPHSTTR